MVVLGALVVNCGVLSWGSLDVRVNEASLVEMGITSRDISINGIIALLSLPRTNMAKRK